LAAIWVLPVYLSVVYRLLTGKLKGVENPKFLVAGVAGVAVYNQKLSHKGWG